MKTIRICLSFLLAAMPCHAAEIFAWNLPLGRYAGFGTETRGMAKCEAPPESTVFFRSGDELWNLAAVEPQGGKPAFDWLVWNATTGRIVAKAGWGDLARLHLLLDGDEPVRQIRIAFEVFDVPADRSIPGVDTVPVVSASTVCRSGQKFEMSRESGTGKVSVSGEAYLGEGINPVVELRMDLSAILEGQDELELTTGLRFRDGRPVRVARDHDGTRGVDIRGTCHVVLPDGTPLAESLLWQHEGKAERFAFEHGTVGPVEIAGGLLLSDACPLSIMEQLVNPEAVRPAPADPFSGEPQKEPIHALVGLPEIQPPSFLPKWIDRPVLDLRAIVLKAGIPMGEADFVVYDPSTQRVYIYAKNPEVLRMRDSWLPISCGDFRTVAFTISGEGESRMVGRPGTRFSLTRRHGETVSRSLVFEPILGSDGDTIDLRLEYMNQRAGKKDDFSSSFVLNQGKALEVSRGGTESPFRITGEVIPAE